MALTKDLALEKAIKSRFGKKYLLAQGANGTEYRICCPFCAKATGKPDKKHKLYINPEKRIYHCFKCTASGDVSKLFTEIKNIRNTVQEVTSIPPLSEASVPPGEIVTLQSLYDDHVAIRYIKHRGFNPITLSNDYGVSFCNNGRVFGGIFDTTNTIVFPMVMNGKTVGWQSRLLYDPDDIPEEQYNDYAFRKDQDGDWLVPPKYFTSPGLDKGRILFNYDNARKFNSVVICEGTFDAIKVGLNAVATLGKGVTDNQIRLIKSYWKFAIILLDPGDADADMARLESSLKLSMPCVRVDLVGYKDAGETPTEEIWKQIINTMISEGHDPADYL